MQTFLDTLIDHLQNAGTKAYKSLVIVLPSQRACVFLRNKLRSFHMGETLMMPQIISIEDFIEQLSGIIPMENTEVMMLFYEAYLSVYKEEEKKEFASFLSWGQTLLQDFNEIDRYLIDQKSFFSYLHDINDQRLLFLEENKTNLIENYIQFWARLQSYYNALTTKMNEQQKGYQGHQYRMAAENVNAFAEETKSKYLFAGFNALNDAEQHIIKSFLEKDKGEVFWDADAYFLNDFDHDASLFLKRFKKEWKTANGFDYSIHKSFSKPKNIEITGVPKNIGQVKYIGQLLESFTADKIANTAVVLADETLLLPMLNSLPRNVKNVNITMGLSLSQVPLTVFVNQFIEIKETNKGAGFYCREVLALLQNSYTKILIGEETSEQLYKLIIDNNWVYIETATLLKSIKDKEVVNVLGLLFADWKSNNLLLEQIQELLIKLERHYRTIEDDIQLTYLQKTKDVINVLTEVVSNYAYLTELKVLRQLLGEKIAAESIDFRGEPLQGLQIMGVLESRCLDFENVIIASVNEGALPSGKKTNSFIPFDLKVETGLPTYKEKDAIYAYHFYRLLQRCKNAYLIYNTQVDEMNSGEKSRFIQQLELEPHPNHTIVSKIASAASKANFTPITEIQKDETVIAKLKALAAYGLSPSALGSYLRDPLTFYEQYILGVRDAEDVEEEVAANTMGTVIHNVLENFYKPFEGKQLLEHDVKLMLKNTKEAIEKEFQKEYSLQINTGVNYITVQAAIQYVIKFLNTELVQLKEGKEIFIVEIESNLKIEVPTNKLDFPIVIKGKVDRVDRVDGQLRIIDYKTGYVNPSHLKIKNWDVLIEDDSHSKALQILMYAYMYCQGKKITEPVYGGIISFKKLNEGVLKFGVHKEKRIYNYEITNDVFDEFLIQIETLITEICDINLPFIKKDEPAYFS